MSHIVSASDEKTGLNKMENNCEANMSDLKETFNEIGPVQRITKEKQNDVDEAKVDCGNDVQLTAVTNFTAKFSDKESVATESGGSLWKEPILSEFSIESSEKERDENLLLNNSSSPPTADNVYQHCIETNTENKEIRITDENVIKEVEQLKNQIRVLQHHQMYQAQRIQYLTLQVSILLATQQQTHTAIQDQQSHNPPVTRSSSTHSNIERLEKIDSNQDSNSDQIYPKIQDMILAATHSTFNNDSEIHSAETTFGHKDRDTSSTKNKFMLADEIDLSSQQGSTHECKICDKSFKTYLSLQTHLLSESCSMKMSPTTLDHEYFSLPASQHSESLPMKNLGSNDAVFSEANLRPLTSINNQESNNLKNVSSDKNLPLGASKDNDSSYEKSDEDGYDEDLIETDGSLSVNRNFISSMFPKNLPKNSSMGFAALRSMSLAQISNNGGNLNGVLGHCTSETSKLQELVEQIDKKKTTDKNECEICHRVLSCQSALKLHYRTHTGERPHKCDICFRAFTTRGNLRTHYTSVHRQQMTSLSPGVSTSNSGLECSLCKNRFSDQQSLQHHMQIHLYINNKQQEHVAQLFQNLNTEEAKQGVGINGHLFSTDYSKQPTDATNNQNEMQDISLVVADNENQEEESIQSPSTESCFTVAKEEGSLNNDESNSNYKSEKSMSKDTSFDNNNQDKLKYSWSKEGCNGQRALDLTTTNIKPIEVTSSSVEEPKNENTFASSLIASNSLSALAQLASNSSLLRSSRILPTHQLDFQACLGEENRNRKSATACDICSKPFTCQSALDIHLRSHTKERPYKCRFCERGFTTKGNLKQHLLTHNVTEIEDKLLEPVASPKPFNQTSVTVSGSESHLKTSIAGEKRHLENVGITAAPDAKKNYPRHWCHVCQKQFSSASSLQIHNRTHTGEKPFACTVCGRAFTTKGNLKVHMGTHVWGAGGSRRGRRISMDNPIISPWMQNTSVPASSNQTSTFLQSMIRFPGPIPDRNMSIQQYAAFASRGLGAKPIYSGFDVNSLLPLNNNAATRFLMSSQNGQLNSLIPATEGTQTFNPSLLRPENSNKLAAQLIWKACQRAQGQVS